MNGRTAGPVGEADGSKVITGQVDEAKDTAAGAASYAARPIRRRATKAEMEARNDAIVELAYEHGPASVRHIYYQAVVAGVPGITKNQPGYNKVQRALLHLRRDGEIAYDLIVDSTRWMRKPTTWGSLDEALAHVAATYRRDLWRTSKWRVEVWCESDSIASTLYATTSKWDVPLMATKGYTSETFAWSAANAWESDHRCPVVLYVGDHDPAGLEIEERLRDSLWGHSRIDVPWRRLGVTWDQVADLDLPGTQPKKAYGYPLAVEAEALRPGMLRELVEDAIASYVDPHQLQVVQAAEESEKELLHGITNRVFAGRGASGGPSGE